MKNLVKQLQQLDHAVPEAPDFVAAVMRRILTLPSPAAPVSRSGRYLARLALGAVAACFLVGLAVAAVVLLSASPQKAFGQVVQRIANFDSVRRQSTLPRQ